jgi:hypothetical protein
VIYSASGLPAGVTFGSSPGEHLEGPRTYAASELPDGLRICANVGLASGPLAFEKRADTNPADERPAAPEEEVKPDFLIDPPERKPDELQEPPGSADR